MLYLPCTGSSYAPFTGSIRYRAAAASCACPTAVNNPCELVLTFAVCDWSDDRLVGWLACCLVDNLVGWLIG